MAASSEISVLLPAAMVDAVRNAFAGKEHMSSDQIIRDALNDWIQKRDEVMVPGNDLRQLWQESVLWDDAGIPADGVLNRLESKYQAMVDAVDRASNPAA